MPLTRLSLPRLPMPRAPLGLADAARRWSLATQTRARRNAMVSLTSMAQLRAEREDADAYLEDAARRREGLPVPSPRRSAGS